MTFTAFDLASRFIGIAEVPGADSNPAVLTMLRLDTAWPGSDDVPWCSAFVNYIAWLLRLPRSKSLAARSWLDVGIAVPFAEARVGFDILVLTRAGATTDPTVRNAPGHVGFYAGRPAFQRVAILGGNQSNRVSVADFDSALVLGVRRLLVEA